MILASGVLLGVVELVKRFDCSRFQKVLATSSKEDGRVF